MDLKITYDDHQIMTALRRLQQKTADMTPAMREIGEEVLLSVKRNFEDEGRPVKWKKSRRVLESGGQTLSDTARLRNSMTYAATADRVEIGTNVKYAAIHHFGGVIKREAREQVIHFRQQVRGKITRATRNDKGRLEGGDLFSKKHRAHYAMKVTVGGHTIKMPARPFLMIQEQDKTAILNIIRRYLETP